MNSSTAHNHYNDSSDIWDINIEPKQHLLQLNLKELWQYKDLVMLMVKRDFVAKYKQTILGPLWHIIQPVLNTAMAYLIFNVIANISTDNKNAILFQLSGVTIWSYFAACLTSTSTTFTTNASIFGKVYFPRMVMPIAIVISNLLQMAVQFGLLFTALLYFGLVLNVSVPFSANLLLIPVVILLMAGLGLGVGIIISALTTKYKDLTILVTFGVQLLMYASAVPYPLSQLLAKTGNGSFLYLFVKWNPISTLVESFRNAVLGGGVDYEMLLYATAFTLVTLLLGVFIFQKVERTFMDTV